MKNWKVAFALALTHSLLCLAPAMAQDMPVGDPDPEVVDPITPPVVVDPAPVTVANDDEVMLDSPSGTIDLPEHDNEVPSGIGFAITVGAGVLWFSDSGLNEQVDIGGMWDARLAIGTRWPATLEVSYTGSLNNIEDPNSNVSLFSNGLDAKIRVQLPFDTLFMPYIFGGVGWRNYGAVNWDDNESATLNIEDDVLETPVGAGFAFRFNNILIDLRGTYRFAFFTDNTDDTATLRESNFNNLSGVLSAGVEF